MPLLKHKKKAPSLNEASYCGINLMRDMTQLIMLFRTNKYIFVGDIRKAFLMIHLKSTFDRNKFCFLLKVGHEIVCYRFTTIIFGFNASPFILNYVLQHHVNSFPKDECTEMMQSSFFVDNLVKSLNDEDKLMKLYSESVARLALGNFELRSCNSNSKRIQEVMKRDGKFVEHGCDAEKVLGYNYFPSSDIMKLGNFKIGENPDKITKRFIVSQTSKVFDPLNVTSPVTIRSKTLISKLWKDKKSDKHWDEAISGENCATWNLLKRDLEGLSDVAFPRYSLSEDLPTDLYLFSDASREGYGYVAYAVQEGQSGYLLAKTKVAPQKSKSLPTLELMGALLAYRGVLDLVKTYRKMKINKVFVACDAQIVISWILSKNVKTKNIYARNRILDVHAVQDELKTKYKINIMLKYIATDQNPADLLTRGIPIDKFKQNLAFWLKGPKFIQSKNVVWPTHELGCLTDQNKSLILCTQSAPVEAKVLPLVAFDRFSKINKLLSTTARTIEAIEKMRKSEKADIKKRWGSSDFNLGAKIHLISIMQQAEYNKEIQYLKKPEGQLPSLVHNLNLFLDKEGILRAGGRIAKHVDIEFDLAYPVLLAKKHHLTNLVVEDCHERCLHLGVGATLNKVRLEGFWIPKARQVIRKILRPCFTCRRFNALAFKYPKVTNLLKHRVNLVQPFRQVGIDFTGETILADENKQDKKHYLLVFTCLTIRAIHIEVLPDRDTKSVVLAFVRFTNIYGIPSHLYSDNEKSFIAGGEVLKEVFKDSLFLDKYLKYNIKHIRIPCYSAWVGSTWERLIRVIKACLYKAIGSSRINYFQMTTIISDVINAVNSRPLTYRCAGDHSLEVISPNCFVKPYVKDSLMFSQGKEDLLSIHPPSRKAVVSALKNRDKIVNEFKNLWFKEYLLSLREQCKDLHDVDFENKVKVNDIVLVKGPPLVKRPFWKLGRVVELFPGDDGKIRSVKVKRTDGEIALHSVSHLYPMELSLTHAYNGTRQSPVREKSNEVGVNSNEVEIGTPWDTSGEFTETSNGVVPIQSNAKIKDDDDDDMMDSNGVVPIQSKEKINDDDMMDLDLGLEEVGEDLDDELQEEVDFIQEPDIVNKKNYEDSNTYPSGRPKRIKASKGRPLDDQFIFFKD